MERTEHARPSPPDGTWAVVPAFNEASAIAGTVAGIAAVGCRCIVIDDASTDPTAEHARRAGALVIRHAVNRGQGAALETGIRFCLGRGARFIVTFDADGQHDPADIGPLVAPLVSGDAEIVLGSRFLGTAIDIPRSRLIALKAAVLITRASSGLAVTDTHNGLRAMSRRAAEAISFTVDRMGHASEILDQIRQHGLRWTEAPVTVRYTPYSRSKGQSSAMAVRSFVDYLAHRVFG